MRVKQLYGHVDTLIHVAGILGFSLVLTSIYKEKQTESYNQHLQ